MLGPHDLGGRRPERKIRLWRSGPPEGAAQCDMLVAETRALGAAFREAGCEGFATKLESTSGFLYTFVLC